MSGKYFLNHRNFRIRVGRNVEGFGLSPGITKAQRLAIENAAKEAFKKLSDGLGGTYHPLQGMNEDVRKQMVDDHFLFMSGDKNLQVNVYTKAFLYKKVLVEISQNSRENTCVRASFLIKLEA